MGVASPSQPTNPRAGINSLRIPLGVAAAGSLLYVAWIEGVGGPGLGTLMSQWVYNGALVAAAATCLLRARLVEEERGAWLAFGIGILCWAAGDIYYAAALESLPQIPYPSIADIGFLAVYPAMYVGIALLVKQRVAHLTASIWLDGTIGALASAALATAVLGPALVGLTNGDVAAVITNLAYPLGDLLLLSFIAAAVMVTGARLRWLVLGAGIALWAAADSIYLYRVAAGSYVEDTLLDALWPIGALVIASAAAMRVRWAERRENSESIVLPALFAMIAIGLLVYDHYNRISELSLVLAAATVGLVVVRLVMSFRENGRLFAAVEAEAMTDPLTGLANRRQLLSDLGALLDSTKRPVPESTLAMFDLDGFKAYNDSFGHPAGDLLLRRLGRALTDAVSPRGTPYRLGGDEFCLLVTCDEHEADWIVAAARVALSEKGDGFAIGASTGVVRIPAEAAQESMVLHLADKRMYAEKGERSSSAAIQTRDVLVRILKEREPALNDHLEGVARLAAVIGRRLGLDAEALDVLARAAELHDIGKIAIPDRILHKPRGLNPEEWKLLHAHTLIGERILASAPAMAPAAGLVRSSHERWDGAGYPDGLAGEKIPLGSRIIFVCDAFDAITTQRPYRDERSAEEALAELSRNAGTQFDPEVVALFCECYESSDLQEPQAPKAGWPARSVSG